METFRQTLRSVNKSRPHEWFTEEEIMKAYRIFINHAKINSSTTRKQLYIVDGSNSKLEGCIVSSLMKQNKDGLVLVTFQGKNDWISFKFLKSLK